MKVKSLIYTFLFIFLISITCYSVYKTSSPDKIENISYRWLETDTSLTLLNNNSVLWQYNFNSKKEKPYFHPINLNETTITELSPKDHPWHLGLWFSWKYINGINYWEYDQSKSSKPWGCKGKTSIKNIVIEKNKGFSSEIQLDISYHTNNTAEVLNEKRIIKISKPSENGFYIDYTLAFKAIADTVVLDRTPLAHEKNGEPYGGYAGLSLRFNNNLKNPTFLNSDDTSVLHGKSLKWAYYGFQNQKDTNVGAVIFDHPKNLNHPTPWHITNQSEDSLYFLQPAPIFHKPHTMYTNDTLILKYRVQFINGKTNTIEIKNDWELYLNLL